MSTTLSHASIAVLFIGMLSANVVPAMLLPFDKDRDNRLMVAVLLLALALTAALRTWGAWRPPITHFGAMLGVATVLGLPGLIVHPSPERSTGLMFFSVLLVRNYLCFSALPRASCVYKSRFENVVIIWLLVASILVMLGSLRTAFLSGVSLYASVRLTGESNNWLNANTTGVYTAIGILCAAMGQFLPWFIRLPTIFVGSYVLLLTQSRASISALLIALAANGAVLYRRKPAHLLALCLLGCLITAYTYSALGESEVVRGDGQVSALLERTVRTERGVDPWSGRTALIREAISRVGESPLVGFGYMSAESRFENGYLSLALETGLLGFSVCVAFVVLILNRVAKLSRNREFTDWGNLARYTVCLTAFGLVHAMGERTHLFQIGFAGSNAWAVLAGLVFVHTSHPVPRWRPLDFFRSAARRTKIRPYARRRTPLPGARSLDGPQLKKAGVTRSKNAGAETND